MINVISDLHKIGQSVWYDYIRRGIINSGELAEMVNSGITGLTSNPTVFEKAIVDSDDYDEDLVSLSKASKNDNQIFEIIAIQDIRAALDLLRPVYDSTAGTDGFVSLEVNPMLAYDAKNTVTEARRLHSLVDRPNLMIKVPATSEGIPAVRTLIGEGINVNVTLIFSIEKYVQVIDAYMEGLRDYSDKGGNLANVASVASFFVSRVDTAVDKALNIVGNPTAKILLGKAAIANAKLAYRVFTEKFSGDRFLALRSRGPNLQRPLWASTGTKNIDYSDVLYVESLIGKDTVNTMPPSTLSAFIDHGSVGSTIDQDMPDALSVIEELEGIGINMKEVTSQLLVEGVEQFQNSYNNMIGKIGEKKLQIMEHGRY